MKAFSLSKQCSRVHQNTPFSFRKLKNFLGSGMAPSQTPLAAGGPPLSAYGASTHAPSAPDPCPLLYEILDTPVNVMLVFSSTGGATAASSSSRLLGRRGRTAQIALHAGDAHDDKRRGTGASSDARREVPPRPAASAARSQARSVAPSRTLAIIRLQLGMRAFKCLNDNVSFKSLRN